MNERDRKVVQEVLSRRKFLQSGAAALGATAITSLIAACTTPTNPSAGATSVPGSEPTAGAVANQAQGVKRKVILIPQDAGDWNAPARVGARDFSAMAGWDFQHIGNPVYSVENHVEQVNNAIAAKPDIIITALESLGLVPAFQKAQAAGITMVIFDQGIDEEAAKLGVPVINQDELAAGIINGNQAATVAHKTLGKTEGIFGIGNGNPGSTSIDKRQNGSEMGILAYNEANGTNFTTDKFADDEFFDPNSSIQKWSAKLDQYGDKLIGMIGVGNPAPLVKAAEGHGIEKGKIVIGSTDASPEILNFVDNGSIYWGIDQQFPAMGFYATAAGWLMLERGFPTKTIRVGGDLVTKENVAKVKERTDKWVALAKQYGDLK
jgi:ABC-type sugar transport system substrate-binding protein